MHDIAVLPLQRMLRPAEPKLAGLPKMLNAVQASRV